METISYKHCKSDPKYLREGGYIKLGKYYNLIAYINYFPMSLRFNLKKRKLISFISQLFPEKMEKVFFSNKKGA